MGTLLFSAPFAGFHMAVSFLGSVKLNRSCQVDVIQNNLETSLGMAVREFPCEVN